MTPQLVNGGIGLADELVIGQDSEFYNNKKRHKYVMIFVSNFRSGSFYNLIFQMNVFLNKNDEWLEVIELNVVLK